MSPVLRSSQARGEPRRRAGAQRIGIEALRGSDSAGAAAAVTEEYRDRIVRMARLNPYRAGNFLSVQLKLDDVFRFDLHPLRHFGADEHGVVPGELGHRLGQLLQPAVVGELAVVDGGIAANVEFERAALASAGLEAGKSVAFTATDFGG